MRINLLTDPQAYHREVTNNLAGIVSWSDPDLEKIVRFRLIGNPGYPYLDVSYCHGQLKDGTYVRVELPFGSLLKRGWKSELIRYARRHKVFAKKLGLFDNVSILV